MEPFMIGQCVRGWLMSMVALLAVSLGVVSTARAEDPKAPIAPTPKAAPAPTTKPALVAPTTKPVVSVPKVIRAVPGVAATISLPAAIEKPALETAADLRTLQEQVKTIVAKVAPTVVGLRVGGGQGSGVIITDDGYVLTAGHVSGAPGRDVTVMLHNGKSVKAKSFGVNYEIDSGLVKIDLPGPLPGGKWPVAELARSADLKRGQWCIALGHPGGFNSNRTPPLRLGNVLLSTPAVIRTDCTLVGGDSGGPLFDLQGRVIGIHSRIGGGLADNMHVPVDTYRDTWMRLAQGEAWGMPAFARRTNGAYLGVQIDQSAPDCAVTEVYPEGPAAAAGVKAGDVIIGFDNQPVANFAELMLKLGKKRPGDQASVQVKRGIEKVKLKLMLAKRPDAR